MGIVMFLVICASVIVLVALAARSGAGRGGGSRGSGGGWWVSGDGSGGGHHGHHGGGGHHGGCGGGHSCGVVAAVGEAAVPDPSAGRSDCTMRVAHCCRICARRVWRETSTPALRMGVEQLNCKAPERM